MTEIRYTQDHEWVRLDGDVAVVGITGHAADALGDVVFVELPEPGREVAQGEAVAVVESVKAASDVYAPLAGRITENNADLEGNPGQVNLGPEAEGWFFRMEVATPGEFARLLDRAAYDALAEAE